MKKKIIAVLIMVITICSVIMFAQNKTLAMDGFTYSWDKYGSPPFQVNGEWIYCCQAGGPLLSKWGEIWYSNRGTYDLDLRTAYAISRTNDENVRQNIIWMSDIASNVDTPNWKPGYDTAVNLYNKGAAFEVYYLNLQRAGTQIVIEDTNPQLVDYTNGKYKIGPFKLNFYKSTFSGLADLYLTNENGDRVEISEVMFKNNYIDDIGKINPGDEFYVFCNMQDVVGAKSVKLHATYKYETASGTYTRYECGTHYAQRLTSVDAKGGEESNADEGPDVELLMNLGGRVFLDRPSGKQEEDGCFDNNEVGVDGVTVDLFEKGNNTPIRTTVTANGGLYEFKDVSAGKEYYVRFQYNGMDYENTTYQALKRFVANDDGTGVLVDAKMEEKSYATEGRANRKEFNNKFNPVNANTNVTDENKLIYAYTGKDGEDDLLYYSRQNTDEELKNINLGIMVRPKFDLSLKKDLYSFQTSINGVDHTYIYDGRQDEPWTIKINETDIIDDDTRGKTLPAYERKIRAVDINYMRDTSSTDGMLSAKVTYVIKIKNTSSGFIVGTINEIADYYDKDYELESSYLNQEGNVVNWNVVDDTQNYHKMTANLGISLISGEDAKVYVTYNLNREVLDKLLTEEVEPKKNIAEITEFSTTYQISRYDANDDGSNDPQHLIYEKGDVAGLLDEDSHPGNYNPDTGANEDEDDTDMAPDLKLVLDKENVRTIEGNVWEDAPLEEKLEANERIGNGVKDDGEVTVNKVRIQLVNQDNNEVVMETKSDNGDYKFENFIPGRYYIRYYYGETEMLDTNVNAKMYTGQDYKSTIYDTEKHQAEYWYTEDNKLSDARDNWDRRQSVNQYSETLRNKNATILNTTDTSNTEAINTLATNTNMFADTEKMLVESEYARKVTYMGDSLEHIIRNIDFGIIERPRAEMQIDNTISEVVITSSDNQVLFKVDNEQKPKIPNVSYIGKDVQFNMDSSLIHGSDVTTTYKFVVKNISEKDYNNQDYYYTGKTSDENSIVKSKPTQIVNYVPVNMNFYNEIEGWEANKVWTKVNDKKAELQSTTDETKQLIKEGISLSGENNSATKAVDTVLVPEKNTNKLITTSQNGLKPGEKTSPEVLVIHKKIGLDDKSDLRYENMVEIVEAYNEVGRRYYHNSGSRIIADIPGDLDPENPMTDGAFNGGQSDASSVAGNILPPFGKQNTAYYVIGAITLGIVIAGGVFLIKKKVINK